MSRPESMARLGFFPFPEPCLPLLLRHLEPPDDPESTFVLDPCAGEGVALSSLTRALGIPDRNAHAVELSDSRTLKITGEYPEIRILGPASFRGTKISYNAFSLAYVNPPYSDEMGGGKRDELAFLQRATQLLTPGGVLAFVVPESVVFDWNTGATVMRRTLSCRLRDVACYALPEDQRHYKEIVVFGVKRSRPSPTPEGVLAHDRWWEAREGMGTLGQGQTYRLPRGAEPRWWEKADWTPEELAAKVDASPLARRLLPPAPSPAPSPPLPPGQGHVLVLLATGALDGLVWPESEPPHVVRGSAYKREVVDQEKSETVVNNDGSVTTKTVKIERPTMTFRAVGPDGVIHTFTDNTDADQQRRAVEPGDASHVGVDHRHETCVS